MDTSWQATTGPMPLSDGIDVFHEPPVSPSRSSNIAETMAPDRIELFFSQCFVEKEEVFVPTFSSNHKFLFNRYSI